ncbi:MAG TPA: hypothetical protein VNO43_12620 [Candidatus Eisenbacteria bacterium]|nr:hypothetical protein [Candidatus Eisenbacteria bacterium]
MKQSQVYKLQNIAIHAARAQLEERGILDPWAGLDQVRDIAAELNLGIRSISKLSLEQRRALIDRLIDMGAQVKNPIIYDSDLRAEEARSGKREPRKVLVYSRVTEEQQRLLDTLAGQIQWRQPDGYVRFCYKLFRAPRPRNSKEVTRLRIALQSILAQQNKNTG